MCSYLQNVFSFIYIIEAKTTDFVKVFISLKVTICSQETRYAFLTPISLEIIKELRPAIKETL